MYNEHADYDHHVKEVETCVELLRRYVPAQLGKVTALDVGAGQGMHAGPLAEHFAHVVSSDIINYSSIYDGAFIKLLSEKYVRLGHPLKLDRTQFIQTNAEKLL